MKRNLYLPALIAFALLLVFSSCSNKSGVPVPADAAFVIHVDGKSLSSKLSWDEIKQNEWYKKTYAQTTDSLARKVLDNPEASGIDIKSDAYFFVTMRGKGGFVGFTCNISDEKAFASFMEKVAKPETVKKDGSISLITEHSSVISWNSNRFVAIADAPGAGAGFGGGGGKRYSEDSLVVIAKDIYKLKGKKSIGSNSKFADMLKEPGDAHFWVNTGAFYGSSLPPMLAATKVASLFDGNFTTATLNFENGKIAVDARQFMNKDLMAIYKKNPMKNVDPAILKKIPTGDVAAAIAINYPPAALKEIVTLVGVDGLLSMFLGNTGLSIDDVVKAANGDIVFTVSDFKVTKEKQTIGEGPGAFSYEDEKASAKLLFGIAIGDKTSFDKVANTIKQQFAGEPGLMEKAKNNIAQQTKDGWYLVGNDSVYLNGFGAAATDHPFISKISGHPMGGYIDIQKFITGARPVMDSSAHKIADEAMKVWQDILFYGGGTSGDASTSHFEINFVDKNTNSLKQLNKFLDFVASMFMKKTMTDVVIDEEVTVDTTATITPAIK
ncbi:MAG TPA: DUF4836 family protein [Chitinophagaceae bacterium]